MLARLNDLLKKHRAVASSLLMLTTVVCYRGVLSGGFVSDDVEQILNNPYIKNPHLWRRIFLGRVWSFAGGVAQASFYRPLHMFTYWLICRADGFNPAAYHSVQLALYALTVWVVYRIARKFLANELAAFVGALIWTLHPLHVEAVAWAAAIPEIGCTLFFCSAFGCSCGRRTMPRLISAGIFLPPQSISPHCFSRNWRLVSPFFSSSIGSVNHPFRSGLDEQ